MYIFQALEICCIYDPSGFLWNELVSWFSSWGSSGQMDFDLVQSDNLSELALQDMPDASSPDHFQNTTIGGSSAQHSRTESSSFGLMGANGRPGPGREQTDTGVLATDVSVPQSPSVEKASGNHNAEGSGRKNGDVVESDGIGQIKVDNEILAIILFDQSSNKLDDSKIEEQLDLQAFLENLSRENKGKRGAVAYEAYSTEKHLKKMAVKYPNAKQIHNFTHGTLVKTIGSTPSEDTIRYDGFTHLGETRVSEKDIISSLSEIFQKADCYNYGCGMNGTGKRYVSDFFGGKGDTDKRLDEL
jgi:hypothetical protein